MKLATDLQWLEVQLETLYTFDAQGRLTGRNDPAGGAPPRFFFGRTRHGNIWRFRADLSDALVRDLARLAAAEPVARDLEALPERLGAFRERLEEHAPIEFEYMGPAFRFPEEVPPQPGEVQQQGGRFQSWPPRSEAQPSEVQQQGGRFQSRPPRSEAKPSEVQQLGRDVEPRQPCFGIREDGEVVSRCYVASGGPRAAEAGVDTLEGFRRRGYARRVTAAWAHGIRRRGLEPLYSTSWENRSSREVARSLGALLYGVDLHFT